MFDKRIFKKHLNEFFIDVMDICKNDSEDLLTFDKHLPVFFSTGKYKKFTIQKSIDYEFLILRKRNKKIEELHSYSLLSKFFVTKDFQNYDKKLQGTIYEHLSKKPSFSKKLPLKFIVSYLNENKSFNFDKKIFDLCQKKKIPILAVCYGFQYIAKLSKGEIIKTKQKPGKDHYIYLNDKIINVNSFHNFAVTKLPKHFKTIGTHQDNSIEIAYSKKLNILCTMFHPERKNKSQNTINNIIFKYLKL